MNRPRLHRHPRRPEAPDWERPLPVGGVRFDPTLRTAAELMATKSLPEPASGEGPKAA